MQNTDNRLGRALLGLLAVLAAALMLSVAASRANAFENVVGTPIVINTNPIDGAYMVDRDANIKAKFSERMLKSSIYGRQTFRLYAGHLAPGDIGIDYSGCSPTRCMHREPVPALVSYNNRKKLAVLNPSARLAANFHYTAVVEGAADGDVFSAVKDMAGSEMATDHIWYFSTGPQTSATHPPAIPTPEPIES